MKHEQYGPYRIVKLIGRGGMGSVYEAVDSTTGREVAIKTLASYLADDAGLRRRFFSEIETLKSLVHPGIVRLLAYGEQEGMPYFAMELVRGRSLEDRLRREGPLDWKHTIEIATAVGRTLKVAHDHGVVHRDLKPANILLADDGAIKLADFGIAKLYGQASLTAHGSVVGTAEYMAPEQAEGRTTDHRVDFYALGASMFAMLSGHPPFNGTSMVELLDKHRRTPPPRIASEVAGVPPELDELIDRLLAKEPERRPATALVLVRLFEAIVTVAGERAASAASAGTHVGTSGATFSLTSLTSVGTAASKPAGTAAGRAEQTTPENTFGTIGRPIDLLAPTMAPPAMPAVEPPPHRGGGKRESATTHVDTGRQTRFTTVENLAKAEEAHRRRAALSRAITTGLATLAAMAAVAFGAYAVLRPPTADESYEQIIEVVDGGGDLRDADATIRRFLAEHGDDARAGQVRSFAERLTIDDLERDFRRPTRRPGDLLDAAQRDYLLAMERAEVSASAGVESLVAWLALHEDAEDLKKLVERQIERLQPAAAAERIDDARRLAAAFEQATALESAARNESDATRAAECSARRTAILKGIVELFSDRPHARESVREAARLLERDTKDTTP